MLIIGGIYFIFSYFSKSPQEIQTQTTPQTSIDQPANDAEGGTPAPTQPGPKTFTSEKFGWSITYPEGIYLTQVQIDPGELDDSVLEAVDFSSQQPGSTPPPPSQGSLNLSVQALILTSNTSLENAATDISEEEDTRYGLGGVTVSSINLNNTEAYKATFEGNSEVPGWTDVYLAGKDSQNIIRIRYYYTGDDYKTTAEEMVSSFKIN